jgi:predicted DCC family thiol-disulfide oxidoreductase YuxK
MAASSWEYKLLYDGDCPLCLREVKFLQRRDHDRGRIAFVNIADPNYDPEENAGISFEQAMGRIHAITADGTILTDMDVFRQLYRVIGLGWIYEPTRWPLLRSLTDRIYSLWASVRLPLTGRPSLASLVAQRRCLSDRCHINRTI